MANHADYDEGKVEQFGEGLRENEDDRGNPFGRGEKNWIKNSPRPYENFKIGNQFGRGGKDSENDSPRPNENFANILVEDVPYENHHHQPEEEYRTRHHHEDEEEDEVSYEPQEHHHHEYQPPSQPAGN